MEDTHDNDDFETYYADPDQEWIEALGDHLILEAASPVEERTHSGLVLPKTTQSERHGYRRYRVIAAGPLCSDDRISEFPEPSVQPGDIVLAPAEELGVYREGGVTYYIAQFDMIAAVIRRGDEL